VGQDGSVQRKRHFHLDLSPTTTVPDGHQVTFVGATFHTVSVMIEYDVVPPIDRSANPFGPVLIGLVVADEAESGPYPTMWEDFDWSFQQPGRMTTRLERRPPPNAKQLEVSVRALHRTETPGGFSHLVASDHELVAFTIDLPPDHAAPSHVTVGAPPES
jgi:hypothetical protein